MQKSRLHVLVEGAVMIALATILSYIRIFKLPWGGSITLVSMLPIILYSIKYGIKHGLGTAFIFSLILLFSLIFSFFIFSVSVTFFTKLLPIPKG